jgi:hypothetical protein
VIVLRGRGGAPVGSKDGDWLFDEHGKPVGTVINGEVIYPPTWKPVGTFRGNILYDQEGHPAAIGPDPKLRMIAHLRPRLGPMAERLVPVGKPVGDEADIELRPPFDTMSLVSSLVEFGRSQ